MFEFLSTVTFVHPVVAQSFLQSEANMAFVNSYVINKVCCNLYSVSIRSSQITHLNDVKNVVKNEIIINARFD